MAKITVVIPAYNAANTIRPCLDSVCEQRRPVDEIIVVDDGSSDATSSIVSAYSDKVKLIVQENQGSAKARQTGTDAAVGDYIAYLDSDDCWLDDHLLKVERALSATTVDFLFTDLRRARPGASPSEYSVRNSTFFPWFRERFLSKANTVSGVDKLYEFSQQQALDLLLKGYPVFPSTVVVSRKVLQSVGEWDVRFKRCQDFDFVLRIARKFGMYYFDDVHTILSLHEGNSDANAYVLMQKTGGIKVLKTHLEENRDNPEYSMVVKHALSAKLYDIGRRYMQQEDYNNAISTFIETISYPGKRTKALIQLLLSAAFVSKNYCLNLMKHSHLR